MSTVSSTSGDATPVVVRASQDDGSKATPTRPSSSSSSQLNSSAAMMTPTTAAAAAVAVATPAKTTLQTLAGMGLEALRQQPWRLEAEAAACAEDVRALSLAHYRLHIDNNDCATVVAGEARGVQAAVEAVPPQVEALRALCVTVQQKGTEVQARHRRIQRTMRLHNQLLDLLEVPQLMETCVRNNLYDKALDLDQLATTLARRHELAAHVRRKDDGSVEVDTKGMPGSARIIYGIVHDVRESTATMRLQLLRELRSKASLPTCLRVIGHLRTLYTQQAMAALTAARSSSNSSSSSTSAKQQQRRGSDATSSAAVAAAGSSEELVASRLRSEFLQCRDAWHMKELESLPASSPYTFLVKAIELQRKHWSDIVGQYHALFATASKPPRRDGDTSTKATATATATATASAPVPAVRTTVTPDDPVLHRWLTHRVRYFLALLTRSLEAIDEGSALANLLDSTSYFGARLARVGADFRAHLPPIFERRVMALLSAQWRQAALQFEQDVCSWEWAFRLVLHAADGGRGSASTSTSRRAADTAPPPAFISLPPLADLTNALLGSLNDFRQCAPVSIAADARQLLRLLVTSCAQSLARAQHQPRARAQRSGDGTVSEREARHRFHTLAQTFCTTFVPFIARCVQSIVEGNSASPAAVADGDDGGDEASQDWWKHVMGHMEAHGLYEPPPPPPLASVGQAAAAAAASTNTGADATTAAPKNAADALIRETTTAAGAAAGAGASKVTIESPTK